MKGEGLKNILLLFIIFLLAAFSGFAFYQVGLQTGKEEGFRQGYEAGYDVGYYEGRNTISRPSTPPYHLLPILEFARNTHVQAAEDEELLKKYNEVFSYAGRPYIQQTTVEAQLKWVRVYDELIDWLEAALQQGRGQND